MERATSDTRPTCGTFASYCVRECIYVYKCVFLYVCLTVGIRKFVHVLGWVFGYVCMYVRVRMLMECMITWRADCGNRWKEINLPKNKIS